LIRNFFVTKSIDASLIPSRDFMPSSIFPAQWAQPSPSNMNSFLIYFSFIILPPIQKRYMPHITLVPFLIYRGVSGTGRFQIFTVSAYLSLICTSP
jgi:hypothetical protein